MQKVPVEQLTNALLFSKGKYEVLEWTYLCSMLKDKEA